MSFSMEKFIYNFVDGHDATGESTYDIWKQAGHDGGAAEFLEFMRTGTDGKSAYDIWLDAGNSGSVDDFLESLRGAEVSHSHDDLYYTEPEIDEKITEINDVMLVKTAQDLTAEEINNVRQNIHMVGVYATGLTYTPYEVIEEGLNTSNHTVTEVPLDPVVAEVGAEIYNDYVGNIATGYYAIAQGYKTQATGNYSHTEGWWTTASGQCSVGSVYYQLQVVILVMQKELVLKQHRTMHIVKVI